MRATQRSLAHAADGAAIPTTSLSVDGSTIDNSGNGDGSRTNRVRLRRTTASTTTRVPPTLQLRPPHRYEGASSTAYNPPKGVTTHSSARPGWPSSPMDEYATEDYRAPETLLPSPAASLPGLIDSTANSTLSSPNKATGGDVAHSSTAWGVDLYYTNNHSASISKEEENWWDMSLISKGRVKPGPGLLPSGLMEVLHNDDHAPLRVAITPPDLLPEPFRAPSTTDLHLPPGRQELLGAVPHPHAYFCAKDYGWLLIHPSQGQQLPTLSLDKELCPYPLPDASARRASPNCILEVAPEFGARDISNGFKPHHFHRYPSAVRGSALNPPFTNSFSSFTSSEESKQSSAGVDPPLNSRNVVDPEEDILLDLFVCCQCQTHVIATPPKVTIPAVISPELLEKLKQDRLDNPTRGSTGPKTYMTALETLLMILENLIWRRRTSCIKAGSIVLARKVGRPRTVELIFEELGFCYFPSPDSDINGDSSGMLSPPNITGSTPESSLARAKILRAWVELGILAHNYQKRHARDLKDYTAFRKFWIQADSAREDIQRTLGSHHDQMTRGLAVDSRPPDVVDLVAWKFLGTTLSTHSAVIVEYAYKRQIHCHPLGTAMYFTCLNRIRRWAYAARDASYPALGHLFTTESNRGLWTNEDLQNSAQLLGLMGNDEEILANLTLEVIKGAWDLRLAEVMGTVGSRKTGGTGTVGDRTEDQLVQENLLKNAFRILAESTGDANVMKGYEDAIALSGSVMSGDATYKPIGNTPNLDDGMSRMVYSMKTQDLSLEEKRMEHGPVVITDHRKSGRSRGYAETERAGAWLLVPRSAQPRLHLIPEEPATENYEAVQEVELFTEKSSTKNHPLAVATITPLNSRGTSIAESVYTEHIPAAPLDNDISNLVVLADNDRISSGGFGDLFLGIHKELGKVAMKRPHVLLNETSLRRFLREVHLWCNMSHRYILPCLGTCKIGREVYMVSPFIENGDLMTCMQSGMALDRSKLLYEIAEALAHLHHRGIVHGDVKAQNVLLSNDGSALLCDFGLAKAFDTMVTSTESKGAGSVRWMAPELLHGESRSMASDVYSFGITIAEVLSGRPPYGHLTENVAVIVNLLTTNRRPPREPLQSAEGRSYIILWDAAEKCWVTDPKDRPYMAQVSGMLFPATLQRF